MIFRQSHTRLINFVTDARAVLSEILFGNRFYTPILNWTLELLKLNTGVLLGAFYSMLNLESILTKLAAVVEVKRRNQNLASRSRNWLASIK